MATKHELARLVEFSLPWLRDSPELQPANLARLVDSEAYAHRKPFPHVVIDLEAGLFPRELLHNVLAELPESTTKDGCANSTSLFEASRTTTGVVIPTSGGSVGKSTSGKFKCFAKPGQQVRKSQITSEKLMGVATRALFGILRSPRFVNWLEAMSGLHNLIADPSFYGSGVHLVGKGGYLEVHSDFNFLLGSNRTRKHRRLNAFVYLNPHWRDEFGGHLELWDRNMTGCVKRLLPKFGRFVAFSSTDYSYHGHPTPLTPPEGRMRRSVAMYYYTKGSRPVDECYRGDCTRYHTTTWQRGHGVCAALPDP